MAELARGSVADRPWGRTFAALGLRGVTGQLTLFSDGKRFVVAFDQGAVVAAASPLASDAAVRVALTSHLVSSSQVPEISRRQAATPDRDEVDVIAELARLGAEHARRLRRRVIAQRAARTFSIDHGEFVVTDRIDLEVLAGCELDVRAIVYLGARGNLLEQRLLDELDRLGAWFRLKPGVDDDLPQFGFTDVEQPVIERLRDGGTLADIEAFAASFVDERTVRAVVYALAVCGVCELAPPAEPRSKTPSRVAAPPVPPPPVPRIAPPAPPPEQTQPEQTQPMLPMTEAGETGAGAGADSPPAPPSPRRITPPLPRTITAPASPEALRSRRPTPEIDAPTTVPIAVQGLPPAADPPARPDPPARAPSTVVSSKTVTRISTVPPPPRPSAPLASGSSAMRPSEEIFDAPTWRDPDGEGGRASEPASWRGDGASHSDASGPVRAPRQDAERADDRARRASAPRSDASSGAIRIPAESAVRGSSPSLPSSGRRRRNGSSPGQRVPLDQADAGPGLVVRRLSASRPPVRQVSRVDTPQSHSVKALIAQRLKLLDSGADHFQLLGVPVDVGAEALRKAYFALARQLHPDRLAALGISDDGKHAQRLFAQINAGFAVLSDRARRAQYLDVLRRGGEAAVRAEQARAEELARRILEAEEAFRRGELALRRDQPQAAVTELERALRLNPEEPDYHAMLAWSRFCAAPDKPAIAAATRTALDKVIQRAPRTISARFYLGRVERMLGRDQDALRHFRDVQSASPGHAEAASEIRALEARLGRK